uniref:Small ribosomal subunit protein uS3c n=1 Tax=Neomeris sp. HV02668 TaxID=1979229 RepID=A0A1W5YJS8_9CHLO|nr:ribosomal protein S3 [Neomeris sp. HV02668]
MGQKIHPLGFRLGISQTHRSYWFSSSKNYAQYVFEDYFLRSLLFKKFSTNSISDIIIERKLEQIKIEIRTARPGFIIGRDANTIKQLRTNLEKLLIKERKKKFYVSLNQKTSPHLILQVTDVSNPYSKASLINEFLVEQLEKRIVFRQAIRKALRLSRLASVKGIKIQISGRLNGAEIARTEWIRKGRVPLQTLRAQMDYSYKTAQTIYGILGIKVWTFQGESFLSTETEKPFSSKDQTEFSNES